MSKADEMFKKLGYERQIDETKLAVYKKGKTTIEIGCAMEGYPVVFVYRLNKSRGIIYAQGIRMDELQAINEKVKEMGFVEQDN